MENVSTKHTIIICQHCQGKGHIERSKLMNPHNGEYESFIEVCNYCKGSGRQHKTVKIIEYCEPFDPMKCANKNIRFKFNEKQEKGLLPGIKNQFNI